MFAKLKKKIENDGGPVAGSESPGITSGHKNSVSSLTGTGSIQQLGPSPPGSVTSETPSMQDVSSARDDMVALLQRKVEQCKKLEGNISDLAALVKDKNKVIERLEVSLRQQDEVTNKKLQEQRDEFDNYRDRLIEGYQNEKLLLDKEKTELLSQLAAAEHYKTRYFKKEEETDEFQGLTTQELSKVKHLLLNTEEALTACRSELESKSRQCHAAQRQVEKLTDELGPLKQKLSALELEIVNVKDENTERAGLVTSLSKEKAVFEKRLDEMNIEMTEKQTHTSQLQAQLAALDGDYKTLMRNSDLQRNKTSKQLQEKDDEIDTLQEKVRALEQRVSQSVLSGDDRVSALQQGRDTLEQKLAETRQQLIEVKSTWSDKITQLENQISNLNAKIVEDSEEFAANEKMTNQMRDSFHKQVEDLRVKLEDAEHRALENLELASSKDTHYDKQIEDMQRDFSHQKIKSAEEESQMNAKIMSLEEQLKEIEMTKATEEKLSLSRTTQLQEQLKAETGQRISLETQVAELEKILAELKEVMSNRDETIKTLTLQIQDQEQTSIDQKNTILILQKQVQDLNTETGHMKKTRDDFEKHLHISEKEKESLLENNADLHKQIQVLKSSSSDSRLELQRMVELKSRTIESMTKSEAALRQRLESLEQSIELSEISKAESGLYSDRISEMSKTMVSLQAQLIEKNKIVKKQEQTLKDFRFTLQRELKIQSLPNDDGLDLTSNNMSSISPIISRKFGSDSRLCPKPHELHQNQKYPPPQHGYSQSGASHGTVSGNYSSSVQSLGQTSGGVAAMSSQQQLVPSGSMDALTIHTTNVKRDLNKDINFIYLKHVVLKFMLSRESEAIQLIKAVSMLLNFTHQEQQLIKDTLEWKMSWFGHRPPTGKGQTSRVVPPTL